MKSIQRNTLLIIFMVLTVCLPSCKQEGTGEKWQNNGMKNRCQKPDPGNQYGRRTDRSHGQTLCFR